MLLLSTSIPINLSCMKKRLKRPVKHPPAFTASSPPVGARVITTADYLTGRRLDVSNRLMTSQPALYKAIEPARLLGISAKGSCPPIPCPRSGASAMSRIMPIIVLYHRLAFLFCRFISRRRVSGSAERIHDPPAELERQHKVKDLAVESTETQTLHDGSSKSFPSPLYGYS